MDPKTLTDAELRAALNVVECVGEELDALVCEQRRRERARENAREDARTTAYLTILRPESRPSASARE